MTTERLQTWTVVLGLFSKIWPFFVPSPELAQAWEFSLADLTSEELTGAARHVMASQSHQPTPADLRDAAHGKLQWVDVWKRDNWGSVVLSERAATILQGFPEDWHFAGRTKRSRWAQLGMAMPPPLAEAVAHAIVARRVGESTPKRGRKSRRIAEVV